ncbi:hypothetical protein IJT93_05710 [bacterium]|nr:hypothetical protein [bacterium]
MQFLGVQMNPQAGGIGGMAGPSAAAGRGLPVGILTARGANFSQFNVGQNLFGQVTGRGQDGSYMLRFGNTTLRANSGTPLSVGQQLNVTVTGQQNGQITLNMSSSLFSSMDTQVVGQTLVKMNVPLTESNLSLANSMLEHNLPLDKQSFQSMHKAVSQLPPAPNANVANARIGAACFLQANGIPLTAQNITSLGNFIASHPQIGQQLYSLQGEIKKIHSESGKISEASLELLEKAPGVLESACIAPGGVKNTKSARSRGKALFDSAKRAGIETALTWVGDDEDKWELLEYFRRLHESAEKEPQAFGQLLSFMQSAEENFQALQLLNRAKLDPSLAYYYLQIPLRSELGESAEVWIRYRWQEDMRFIDADNTRIELLVKTYALGSLFFALDINSGLIKLSVKVENEDVLEFVRSYLPVLEDRLIQEGWQTEPFEAEVGEVDGNLHIESITETADISSMESCDVQV